MRSAPQPRLVALDVDHTLITEDHRLTQRTIDAVHRVRAAGVAVTLASSRPPGAMRDYLFALGIVAPQPFVACQGALVGAYRADGSLHVLERHETPRADALAVVALAAAAGLATSWYSANDWFVDRIDAGVRHEADVTGLTPGVVALDRLEHGPEKLLLIDTDPTGATIHRIGDQLPPTLAGVYSHRDYLEITVAGVDKASGVEALARHAGVHRDALVVMGDGLNDLGMFGVAGFRVAPANAHPAVLQAADLVVASNDDDGVAQALDRLVPAAG